jgi:hypothetical protein
MKTRKTTKFKVEELTSRLVDYFSKVAEDMVIAKINEEYEKCAEMLQDTHHRIIILANLLIDKKLVNKELHEVVFDFIEVFETTQMLIENDYDLSENLKVRIGSYGFLY